MAFSTRTTRFRLWLWLIRLIGGDLIGWTWAWQAGGVLNVLALLLFIGSSALAVTGRSAVRSAAAGP